MCGIAFVVARRGGTGVDQEVNGGGVAPAAHAPTHAHHQAVAALQATIAPRGPDGQGRLQVALDDPKLSLVLLASVLHMRGPTVCPQPAVDAATGNVLLWNGEIFGGGFGGEGDGVATPGPALGDTEAVLQALGAWPRRGKDISAHVVHTLAGVQGPWAMAFYHQATQTLHFGRDRLGRRSLVMRAAPQREWLAVCSSATSEEEDGGGGAWTEVKVEGLWRLDLSFADTSGLPAPQLVPWAPCVFNAPDHLPTSLPDAAGLLLQNLSEAVRRRVAAAPAPLPPGPNDDVEEEEAQGVGAPARVAVLYSGGLDCQVLAVLVHLQLAQEGDTHTTLDLINVCFDQGRHHSPDRLAALAGWLELRSLYPLRPWRLVLVDVDDYEGQVKALEGTLRRLIQPCHTPMDFNIACAFYHAARGVGHVACPAEAARVLHEAQGGEGLLRYGKPRSEAGEEEEEKEEEEGTKKEDPGPCSNTLCRRVFKPGCAQHLCGNCCSKAQKKAYWLAASGVDEAEVSAGPPCRVHKLGKKWAVPSSDAAAPMPEAPAFPPPPASSPNRGPLYRSRARVVLLGVGADEQLAGYGRHRSTFRKGGDGALAAELAMDLGRLWTR